LYQGAAWDIVDGMRARPATVARAASPPTENRGVSMKVATIVGLVLTAVGIIGFLLGGIPLGSEETTVGVGPVEVRAETRDSLSIPPLVSGIALVAGIGLIFVGARSER
jgi:preprotein translocase subunit Sss1